MEHVSLCCIMNDPECHNCGKMLDELTFNNFIVDSLIDLFKTLDLNV